MRRFLQRLRTALARPAAVFVYDAGYARTVAGVPIDPARADEILAFLLDRGLIRRLRARGFHDPVLVVDLDLHDGNGTRAAFAGDASVHTFSIHNRTWDDTPAVAATSLALGEGVTDDTYLAALREALPPVLRAHRPALVVYVAGCDPAVDDQLGDWRITPAGMLERDRFVVDQVRGTNGRRGIPLVIVPGGGYGPNAWRYSARFFGWLVCGRVIEPPGDMEIALGRFRPVARQFAESALARSGPRVAADEWSLGEADVAAPAQGVADERVLGHYSRHSLELLLERLGFFKRLRDLGFRHPVLDVEFGHALGETIRLYGDAGRAELLVELRINRSKRAVPGMDVLYVEWLLLQNPRAAFGGRLAPLPGQEHPGLGMLGEVAAWLVVMCETIGLDGVVFVPTHYYAAALGRHRLRFLEPEDQARFEALQEAVAGMSLAEADRAIAQGGVMDDAAGEPVRWRPALMVVPVSGRLKALVAGPSYAELLARARPARPLRLGGEP